jgi:hypothetical protein
MATLNIYDKFGSFLESHHIEGSFVGWMKANVKGYRDSIAPPYSALLNKKFWPYQKHDDVLNDDDVIDVTVEPQDPLTTLLIIISVASAYYAYQAYKDLPGDFQRSERGKSIYSGSARLNQPKPGGIVREAAGKSIIFPDLICPVRRKFVNNEEYLYIMMSITSGYLSASEKNFYIAETPITDYSQDYTLNIYDPGDDVTGNEAHENWYTSLEIQDLKLVTSTSEIPGEWTAEYATDQITSYASGSLISFPFEVDSYFEITSGSNQGVYRVESLSSPDNTATVVLQERTGSNSLSISSIREYLNILAVNAGTYNSSRISADRVYDDSTTSPQTSLTSVSPAESITWKSVNGGVNWEGPFRVAPAGETFRYIELDVFFPSCLVFVQNDGDEVSKTVDIIVQYRAIGSTTWSTANDTTVSPNTAYYRFTEATFDQLGFTRQIDMGSEIEAEIRIRRITSDSTSSQSSDDVFIKRARAKLETKTTYSDVTTAALIVRSTNALARSSENKISVRNAMRRLPTLQEVQDAADGTPFDLSTSAVVTSTDYLVDDEATFINNIEVVSSDATPPISGTACSSHFSDDGTKLLMYDNGVLRRYDLTTAYLPGAGLVYQDYSTAGATANMVAAFWADSGDQLITVYKQPDPGIEFVVRQYDMSTAYDLSTLSVTSDYTTSSEVPSVDSAAINKNGTAFWLANSTGLIGQFTLSTPWDMNTAASDETGSPLTQITYDASSELALASPNANLVGIYLDNYSGSDPTQMWMVDSAGYVHVYTLSTPGDVSTATLDGTYLLASSITGTQTIQVSSDYIHMCNFVSAPSVATWLLDKTTDSRASRSLTRFAANALYEAIGSDVGDIIDWTSMSSLDTTLQARQDYFDGEFAEETTIWEALKAVFLPGFTEPAMKEGKLSPVRTIAGSDYSHLYTHDIMKDEGLVIVDEHYDGQDPDGVDVEYLDEDTFQMETVECRLSGDSGARPKKLQLIGVVNRTRAWRIGMRERRRIFYKPANYQFRTEMDGLVSEYGDAIAVSADVFGSQTGSVTAVSGDNITLDFIPEFDTTTSPNPTYYAAFKEQGGEYSGLFQISMGSPNNVITIIDSPGLDFTPVTDSSPDSDGENTLVTIGTSDQWGKRAIIRNVEPQGDEEVNISAEEYVADMYSDDDNSPP